MPLVISHDGILWTSKKEKTLEIKCDTTTSIFKDDKNMKRHACAAVSKIDDTLNYILGAIKNKHISTGNRLHECRIHFFPISTCLK